MVLEQAADSGMGFQSQPADKRARTATLHSFLNCYLHEIDPGERCPAAETPLESDSSEAIHLRLDAQDVDLYLPLAYYSPTDRHCFAGPGVCAYPDGRCQPMDYLCVARLLADELAARGDQPSAVDELLARVVESCQNTADAVATRRGDDLTSFESNVRRAEQSLVFGHHRHPTPKSRQELPDHWAERVMPELGASFPLHYFGVDPALVAHGSAREREAPELIASELRADEQVPASLLDEHADNVLLPVHPWQAEYLREQRPVRNRLGDTIEYLGPVGREFYPTTSVRTLYHPEASFMPKTTLSVTITNSQRVNKRHELVRGVAVADLLDAGLGDIIDERFPWFDLLADPAYLTVDLGEGESGFETVLRENPFDAGTDAAPVVALCQNPIDGRSRIGTIVETLAAREGRAPSAVAEEWFERYLEIGIRPVLWLYLQYGFGVEAHQQNSVVVLEDGYPEQFYYRDNQGFYFPESRYDRLDAILPGVGERTDTVCPDPIADERMCYWVILNNAFGLISALGKTGLVEEEALLELLRSELVELLAADNPDSSLLDTLLSEPKLRRQSNMLTRLYDVDELEDDLEESLYVEVENPLVTELSLSKE